MHKLKKIHFLFCTYKNISRKTWQKNGVEVIVFNGKKWLNEKHEKVHSHFAAVTNQYFSELNKKRQKFRI